MVTASAAAQEEGMAQLAELSIMVPVRVVFNMIKTRFFEEESVLDLENEVNEFLSTFEKERFIDIKHAAVGASGEGTALKMYTAVVVYEVEDKEKRANTAKAFLGN